MLFGAAGMSSSMAILAGMNYMSQVDRGGSAPGIVSAVFLFVFNTFFAIGWLGMTCKPFLPRTTMVLLLILRNRALPSRDRSIEDQGPCKWTFDLCKLGF
jgi:hypothetical protein